MHSPGIRQAAVAGMFYPDDPRELDREVERLLSTADATPLTGTLVALIAPHAGYQYSGHTASMAYALLAGLSFETVVIVSPSHREYFDGISIFDGSAYRTPLGDMNIDEELRNALTDHDGIIEQSHRGHGDEHAVEVHLPFIQKMLKHVRILPIVMGDQSKEYCYHLGEKLGTILEGKNTLLIASTDLSHYHTYEIANTLDTIMIDDIARFDVERTMADLEERRVEACGGGPTVAVLAAAKKLGADSVKVLDHCNSGDVTGDRSRVVGYLSAAVIRTH